VYKKTKKHSTRALFTSTVVVLVLVLVRTWQLATHLLNKNAFTFVLFGRRAKSLNTKNNGSGFRVLINPTRTPAAALVKR